MYPASPCSSIPIPGSRAWADISCLHVCIPQKHTACWFAAGENVSKESSSKQLEETSLVRAKHAALHFNGGPAWFLWPPPSATHWCWFKPCHHHHSAWPHQCPLSQAPYHGQGNQGWSRKGLWSGKRKAGDTQTEGELWLGKECGAAQLRGPMLIIANFSSTKQA